MPRGGGLLYTFFADVVPGGRPNEVERSCSVWELYLSPFYITPHNNGSLIRDITLYSSLIRDFNII